MSYFWLFPSNEAEASWCLRSTCNNENQIELFCQSGHVTLGPKGREHNPFPCSSHLSQVVYRFGEHMPDYYYTVREMYS
jgi:hypothetical protein